jgi:hypothetical protein
MTDTKTSPAKRNCDGQPSLAPATCSAFREDDSVELFRWQGMLWSRCVTRKRMRDHDGGDDIPAGSVVWRPLTNNRYRMNRLEYVPRNAEVVSRTPNAPLQASGADDARKTK